MNKKYAKQLRSLLRHTPMTFFVAALGFGLCVLLVSVAVVSFSSDDDDRGSQAAHTAGSLEGGLEKVDSENDSSAQVLAGVYDSKTEDARAGQAFADVEILAKAALVYDINTGTVLFEKQAREPYALASITKVMTVVTAQDLLADDDVVSITASALATPGESGLVFSETWRFQDIADFALISSSNDAATAIAETAGAVSGGEGSPIENFVEAMNDKADEIGMSEARFINPSGLDENNDTEAGAVASALDIARLFTYALEEYPRAINYTRLASHELTSLGGQVRRVENTNELAGGLPGLIASKTGYTFQAGGNLAVVVDAGFLKPVVIVALGSTHEGRFADVEALYGGLRTYID